MPDDATAKPPGSALNRAAAGPWSAAGAYRDVRRRSGGVVVVDPRRYRQHRGDLLRADRIYLAGWWTPFVRVRARLPRAADGGTEA